MEWGRWKDEDEGYEEIGFFVKVKVNVEVNGASERAVGAEE